MRAQYCPFGHFIPRETFNMQHEGTTSRMYLLKALLVGNGLFIEYPNPVCVKAFSMTEISFLAESDDVASRYGFESQASINDSLSM
jgi:hypothetical protein